MNSAVMGIAAALTMSALAAGQSGPQPTPAPSAASAADVKALLQEGIALHDKGNFDGAIEKYREALALDPQNPTVLYEMGGSLYAKHDFKAAQEAANRAIAANADFLPAWVLLGNTYDDLGDPTKAIETYRRGIQANPNFFHLHFNLGTTYFRLGKLSFARACFENSASLRPDHASSHLFLGRTYKQQGYRVPAILALTRFLVLESGTKRSAEAMGYLDEIFRAGVERGGKKTTITVNPDAAKDEGDFVAADLTVALAEATRDLTPKPGDEKRIEPHDLDRLATVLAVTGEVAENEVRKGFAVEYYVPLLTDLSRLKLTAAYAALALRSLKSPAYEAWVNEHGGEMNEASKLLARYRWPQIRVPVPEISAPAGSARTPPAPQPNPDR